MFETVCCCVTVKVNMCLSGLMVSRTKIILYHHELCKKIKIYYILYFGGSMMEKLFKLKENGTDVKTEIIAGITTFLAMAYILAVNPSQLGTIDGASAGAILTGTAISAAIATLCMAFFANYPVALSLQTIRYIQIHLRFLVSQHSI